jgi:hypothetical protein
MSKHRLELSKLRRLEPVYAVWNLLPASEERSHRNNPDKERIQRDKQLLHHSASHFLKQTEEGSGGPPDQNDRSYLFSAIAR